MGLFDYIFKGKAEKESQKVLHDSKGYFKTLTAYEPVFTTWNGSIYESELVRAAIDARARHISKLKVTFEGSAKPKLISRMRLQPNMYQSYPQFLYRISTILDNTNNCIITPIYDNDLNVTGYIPVLPQKCKLLEYKGEPWIRYEFANNKVGAVRLIDCALLTKFQYRSDFFGENNNALNETMKLIHVQNQGIEEAVKNSVTYRFMARLDNFALDSDIKKVREKYVANNMAEGNKGGLLLFPNTFSDIRQINQTAYTVDAAQREAIEANVYNYFGVNRDVLQNKAKADDLDAFFDGAVEPFSILLGDQLTLAMYTERERSQGNRCLVTANRLQYMSTTQKVQMAKELSDRGALTIDEVRELFNYPPLPDGAGKMTPIRGEYYDVGEDNNATENE